MTKTILSDLPGGASTIVDLLRWRATHQPEQRAYTLLKDRSADQLHLTYAELDRQARAIAAHLEDLGAGGAPVLLLYPPGLDYIAALFGCMYAGAIGVPAYPPRLNRSLDRLEAIVANAQARIALTASAVRPDLAGERISTPELRALQWLTTDQLPSAAESAWQLPAISSASPALLQYSSGSTSTPKGIVLTHGNLMHNLTLIRQGYQLTPADAAVSWLPLYHDMGLIGGIMQPLYMGSHTVLLSPVAFLQRPLRWLEQIARFKTTVNGGPNFAYELCVQRATADQLATLDLSSWRVAFCGAEPIRMETLDRFAATFAPCGFRREAFYPCYGLAEATLFVSGGLGPAAPVGLAVSRAALEQHQVVEAQATQEEAQTLVGCGQALLDQQIVIADPETMKRCPPGQVGEIWVAGPSVGQGYWNLPEETDRTFRAHLADSGEGPFLRTGDLGFLHGAELFVTGRLKDLIIIRGRNYYPHDLELTVERCHSALRPAGGAAFSVEVAGADRLVVVCEVERHFLRGLNIQEVASAIRQALADEYELHVHAVVLVEPLSIPKTSSGKTQRHACRARFLDGSLKVVGEWRAIEAAPAAAGRDVHVDAAGDGPQPPDRSVHEIAAWLVVQIARQAGIAPEEIDVRRPFAYYGLDSVQAVGLASDLEGWLGRQLAPTLAYDHPSIEALASYLAGATPAPASSTASIDGAGSAERGADPIAIIGIGCRFPSALNPEAFWQLLRNGVDAISAIPAERRYLHKQEQRGAFPQWGGFLEQIDQFDPQFFGITPREAAHIDPQQRLLLEVVWEALEDGGQSIERLAGSRAGVFIGISNSDYGQLQLSDVDCTDPYIGAGSALSIAANRISYAFDLRGPSIAIDTACSSSLVAVHLACQSLQKGECTLALAGGVNVILQPAVTLNFARAGFMAADGRCKAFDSRADGYVRGEGAGAVVLKPLSRALADGDPIYAIIRGSAVNNDGRSNGLTAPSRQAQEAVLYEAYRQAGVTPGQVQYVEAHGTGTALGDPIEALALGAVIGDGRAPDRSCAIGSVKTNIGHLEAAAGVAGLIKTALALQHREIPPSLQFQSPNPHIPFDQLALHVQQALRPWPAGAVPALAGVSSFGFGGTNAHVVLQEAPPYATAHGQDAGIAGRACLLPLSAQSEPALQALARAYQDRLAELHGAGLPDLCYSASIRRSHHTHRLALVARTPAEGAQVLQAYLESETCSGLAVGRARSGVPQVVFVFGGQGPQWWGMGRELLEQEPVVRATLQTCDQLFRVHAEWSLLDEFSCDESCSRLDDTEIAQPALFALQVALACLWQHWGVTPDVVVGHSLGEVAAAHVAGILSLEDAVRLVFQRGRLMQRTAGAGQMAMVELSQAQAEQAIAGAADRLSIAAVNSPTSTVIAGDRAALQAVLAALTERGVLCRELRGTYAFHSPAMESIQHALGQTLQGLEARPARIPIVSTLTGQLGDGRDFGVTYWQRQMREPVRFAAAIDRLVAGGQRLFVEIGPHPVLAGDIDRCLRACGQEGNALASLRRGSAERATMLAALGALYVEGYPLDWRRLYPTGGRYVRLPSYPWQRERYWFEPDTIDDRAGWTHAPQDQHGRARHPLLGRPLTLASLSDGSFWENRIDRRRLAYLDDHRFQGQRVLPGTAYLEMALAAAAETAGAGPRTLIDLALRSPLFVPEQGARTVQLILSAEGDHAASFRIFGRPEHAERSSTWTLHATGKIVYQIDERAAPQPDALEAIRRRCGEEISAEAYYEELRARGLEYGPSFRGITRLWRGAGEALGQVQVPEALAAEREAYLFHPAALDACAQVLVAVDRSRRPLLPTSVEVARFYGRLGDATWCHARFQPDSDRAGDGFAADVRLLDEGGAVLVEALGLRVRYLDGDVRRVAPANLDDWLYQLEWQLRPAPPAEPAPQPAESAESAGTWLIFADSQGVGAEAARLLTGRGDRCVLVSAGTAYARLGLDQFQLRPAQREDIRQLFMALHADHPACRGVLHLWSLDAAPASTTTVAALEAAHALGSQTIVPIVQELASSAWARTARLWLVTRGAQAVRSESALSISQAPVWGLGRTIGQEQPANWGAAIDLDPGSHPDDDGALLFQEVTRPIGENQLAFRAGQAYIARLTRGHAAPAQAAGLRWRLDGSYLITGGMGGLGLLAARWMVEQGARRVILLGRTQLPPRAEWSRVDANSRLIGQISAIRQLESLGASVHLAAVDVSDEAQLAAFLEAFHAEGWPPIRGVVHAAGVLHDQILLQLEPAMLAEVFRAKVVGGWLLQRLLADADLDFFVVFSSAAALLGSAGQGNYAAANAFLDALAYQRRLEGKAALSIGWGPWAEVGLAAASNRGSRLALRGIGQIALEQGLELFGRLLRTDAGHIGVVPIDWTELFQSYPALRESPVLAGFAREEANSSGAARPTGEQEQPTRDTLFATEPANRQQFLESFLCGQVARVVGLPAAALDLRQPLNTLGIDSLMSIELKNRVEAELGVVIPPARLLESPTIAELATLLHELVTAPPAVPAPKEAARPADPPLVHRLDIQPRGSRRPFFCIHPGALDARCYTPLAQALGNDQPVYTLQPAELDTYRDMRGELAADRPLEDIAAQAIEALRATQPHGPYALGGWSMGGILAFEMARLLRTQGDLVALLALFDSPAPPHGDQPLDYKDAELLPAFASYLGARRGVKLRITRSNGRRLDLDEGLGRVLEQATQRDILPPDTDVPQLRALLQAYKAGLRSAVRQLWNYTPQIYPGRISYFRAQERLTAFEEIFPQATSRWETFAAEPLAVHAVPGDHYTMLLEPHVRGLAEQLSRCLSAAEHEQSDTRGQDGFGDHR